MADSKKDKKQEKEKNAERQDDAEILQGGDKRVINDNVSGSKAFFPILVDEGYEVKLVRIDQGVAEDRQENMPACDYFLEAISSSHDVKSIKCFLELKGTNNPDKVYYAEDQILTTIKNCKMRGDFVFAVISGAPKKNPPKTENDLQIKLCNKLFERSNNQKDVTSMFQLLVYVKPNKNCKKAKITGITAPYTVECWNSTNSFIPFPSMFMELINSR